MTEKVTVTRAYRADGAPVGKAFKLVGGRLEQDRDAKRHPDRFEVVEVPAADIAAWVHDQDPSSLLVAGLPKNGASEGRIEFKANRSGDDIALSDEDFAFSEEPGLLLLDFDPKTETEGWDPRLNCDLDAFIEALESVAPGVTAEFSSWASSGSCICAAEGEELRGLRGFHVALPVMDATDIPRAGAALHRRLIAAGYGFAFVTKAGTIHVRSIVDAAVWRPAQPIFVGGASCGPGLLQDRAAHFRRSVERGPLLDTRHLIPDLDETEQRQYDERCLALIEGARNLAARRRSEYDAAQIELRVKRIAKAEGCSEDEARARAAQSLAAERASEGRRPDGRRTVSLSRDAMISTDRGWVSVEDILASPDEWHGAQCADPEEPDYRDGVGVARIHTRGTPNIFSFAHGGCVYWLDRPTAAETFDEFDDSEPDPGPGTDDDAAAATTARETGAACAAPGAAEDQSGPATTSDAIGTGDKTESLGPLESPGVHMPADRQQVTAGPPKRKPKGVAGVQSAAALLSQDFPPVQWLVEGILPRGCWVLAGKPKTGKSWLALDLLLAVAGAREFIGREVDSGPVLYLALEDNERRMQQRLRQLGAAELPAEALAKFQFHTAGGWPSGKECFDQLKAYLQGNRGARLIVVDTLAKVKIEAGRNGTAYDQDYNALGPFQELAARYGVTILLVTHLRKTESADAFDDISGSAAVLGAVDGAMVLSRQADKRLSLKVRGRDLDDDAEYILGRSDGGRFTLVGAAEEVAQSAQRRAVLDHLELVGDKGATAAEIHKALGRKDRSGTNKLLGRMVDGWQVVERTGRYYLPDDPAPGAVGAPAAGAAVAAQQ